MKQLFGDSPRSVSSINLNDLVSSVNITWISIHAFPKLFCEGEFKFEGTIKFQKNGDTFEREFTGTDLKDVFMKVYNFCEGL
jgi:hypothetical protein